MIKKHRIIPKWSLDYDGSLESGCEYRPKDCNKLHFNEDSIYQIKEILGLIKAHRGHIRSSCSLHVHVDASKLSNLEICNIVKAFIKVQPSIVRQFKPLRSRLHHYAKRIPRPILKEITPKIVGLIRSGQMNMDISDRDYFNERYYMLNLQSLEQHGSLEFRIFNGSVQIRTIKRNIKWCIEFVLNNL